MSCEARAVILCGGVGTRLWPLSRPEFPKQFLDFNGQGSLFINTVKRVHKLSSARGWGLPVIVTSEKYKHIISDQLSDNPRYEMADLIFEPESKNTAASLTLAAHHAISGGSDPILFVTPSDHAIIDEDQYWLSIQKGIERARKTSDIVLYGVPPTNPNTEFGYINCEPSSRDDGSKRILNFIEKPRYELAQSMLAQGGFYWNSGMFIVRASVWITAISRFRPVLSDYCYRAYKNSDRNDSYLKPDKDIFRLISAESIDKAVIENCKGEEFDLTMIPLTARWSDLGSWAALNQYQVSDEKGNSIFGDVEINQTTNSLLHSSGRLVVGLGLDDLVVIETPDVVFVSKKNLISQVDQLLKQLSIDPRLNAYIGRKSIRPWGWFIVLKDGVDTKVKKLHVKAKSSLSLQRHKYRSEHWVIIHGVAEVTNGDKTFILTENKSTFIPAGEKHRLTNPGTVPLEVIEVQTGTYFGEDDIERFDDIYGRSTD